MMVHGMAQHNGQLKGNGRVNDMLRDSRERNAYHNGTTAAPDLLLLFDLLDAS